MEAMATMEMAETEATMVLRDGQWKYGRLSALAQLEETERAMTSIPLDKITTSATTPARMPFDRLPFSLILVILS